MNLLTTIVVVIPSVLSLCVSGIYAYIALKKAKESPKDEIWETTTKLLCASENSLKDGDDFAYLYEQLKIFKENGCTIEGLETLSFAVSEKRRKGLKQSGESSKPSL